ncbi:MAG: BrnA antitoxin family protein [Candidatus Accumulibacter sp.]|jgi:uncharacterized protein (DUF4415 family)|nr:BrnA antitoxin family protein [Accumulibacter sp.]
MSKSSVETIQTRDGRKFLLNTPEEDARVTAAAMADPNARPLTDAEWEAVRPRIRIGRPPCDAPRKAPVTLRLDVDVLEELKASGHGWQARVNNALREWLKTRSA